MAANSKSVAPIDVVLHPGDFHFSGGRTRIRTLLGSCVSIVMWHPERLIGGMCHYLLPVRNKPRATPDELDGRFAEEAIALFMRELRVSSTAPHDYVVKLFGGGKMFLRGEHAVGHVGEDVARRNIDVARELLAERGFAIAAEHVGGEGFRQLVFEVWSGDVWLRRGAALKVDQGRRR